MIYQLPWHSYILFLALIIQLSITLLYCILYIFYFQIPSYYKKQMYGYTYTILYNIYAYTKHSVCLCVFFWDVEHPLSDYQLNFNLIINLNSFKGHFRWRQHYKFEVIIRDFHKRFFYNLLNVTKQPSSNIDFQKIFNGFFISKYEPQFTVKMTKMKKKHIGHRKS